MKRFILAGLLLASIGVQAQTRPIIEVRPPLKTATLYLNSMELEHQADVQLPAGTSRLLVANASRYLSRAQEVEVRLGDGVEVLSVGEEDEDDEAATAGPAATNRAAADSLARANDELARLDAELKALEEEKAMLLANRTLPSGTQTNWSTELQKGTTLLRTRLVAIQRTSRQLLAQQEVQKKLVQRMEQRNQPAEQVKPFYIVARAQRAGVQPHGPRLEQGAAGAGE